MPQACRARRADQTRPRAIARRRLLTASAIALALAAAALAAVALSLVGAARAEAAVWVVPASGRAFPGTQPGTVQAVQLDAARNEYQGVQVALRGDEAREVSLSWLAGGDPLITSNTRLHRVYFVKVTTPTTDLHARRGWYPDPLVPREFDSPIAVPATTTPFYLLTRVPADAAPGDYSATLRVANGAETVDVPFTLHVWDFGVRISTRSAMVVSAKAIKQSLVGSGVRFSGRDKLRIMATFFAMMREHGLSPSVPHVWPRVQESGDFDTDRLAADLAPLLDPAGLDLPDTQVLWNRWFPWSLSEFDTSKAGLESYLDKLFGVYAAHGWQDKAYAYILDETTRRAEELRSQTYARLVHGASAKHGFRCRFLLTDDPRPFKLGERKRANRFLFDDVDIWAVRYYYFFGRVPALRARQARGKEVWWYTYASASVARTPSYVIEKPPTDSRAMGWLMERWKVQGLLNWGFNRWGEPVTGNGWRDPYQDPLSFVRGSRRSNGDTCLVYPGYYPPYGLTDPFAPPVSSLRLEALRDGLEEREYLRRARRVDAGGPSFCKSVLATITHGPARLIQANVLVYPKYTHSIARFDRGRLSLARYIEANQR